MSYRSRRLAPPVHIASARRKHEAPKKPPVRRPRRPVVREPTHRLHTILEDAPTEVIHNAYDTMRARQEAAAIQLMQRKEHEGQAVVRILEHHRDCSVCIALQDAKDDERKVQDAVNAQVQKALQPHLAAIRAKEALLNRMLRDTLDKATEHQQSDTTPRPPTIQGTPYTHGAGRTPAKTRKVADFI